MSNVILFLVSPYQKKSRSFGASLGSFAVDNYRWLWDHQERASRHFWTSSLATCKYAVFLIDNKSLLGIIYCYCIIPDGFVQSPLSCLPLVLPLLLTRNNGVEGTIRIGNRTGRKANQKLCSYILQDDNLFPWFTVLESMTLAARLKIGNKSHTYRQFMVKIVIFIIIKEWSAII